ncbi:CopY/TcrY family copper transport repressor [Apilactobacillus bombintestini]|uniref:CopY/TcrY family copper transport repressor n=1 Tax=Apilactobacillus bombintestini TaxID=2419772 RepID=A0A387AZE0_9LACO|nr:CopY/TcrY family copper transport repressor [Apilactobacillus bombintestini]AYF92410.1 CopY/TcrY family copper transport repressor [Apilactobacillus bombintestini]
MDKSDISNSEWEVMRIIWTIGETTSSNLIDILSNKMDWSSSTIKTLLARLCKKEFLKVKKDGRRNIYFSAINEQTAYSLSAKRVFERMCCMHYGETIKDIVNSVELSKSDIDTLITLLKSKKKNAPDKVECKCLED